MSQEHVNAMAVAISGAEMKTERLMVDLGHLIKEVKDFREGCDLHATVTAPVQAAVGEAINHAGEAYLALQMAHNALMCIVDEKKLPKPAPVPTGGGGGGK